VALNQSRAENVSASSTAKRDSMRPTIGTAGNQISPDVESVSAGRGRDRSRPHHDHNTCARHERGAPPPHSGHRPKYDGDNEGGGQCPEQIGGDAWKIGEQADPNWIVLQINRLNRPAVPRHDIGHVGHVVGRHRVW